MTDIATQIRARLDAIAAERVGLDDEERRLRKALDALEPATSETPTLDAAIQRKLVPSLDDEVQRLIDRTPPLPPPMPVYPWQPHYPPRPWEESERFVIPTGPWCVGQTGRIGEIDGVTGLSSHGLERLKRVAVSLHNQPLDIRFERVVHHLGSAAANVETLSTNPSHMPH